jgi:hypothetical protein
VNGYCLDEFTFLHRRKLIPSEDSNRGYPLTFLSLWRMGPVALLTDRSKKTHSSTKTRGLSPGPLEFMMIILTGNAHIQGLIRHFVVSGVTNSPEVHTKRGDD